MLLHHGLKYGPTTFKGAINLGFLTLYSLSISSTFVIAFQYRVNCKSIACCLLLYTTAMGHLPQVNSIPQGLALSYANVSSLDGSTHARYLHHELDCRQIPVNAQE